METFLIKALQLILSLSILVIVHEFGHFIFARLYKIRVEKFYVYVAKRAGLLHDIGKAVDQTQEGTHIQLGVELASRYGEKPEVIHAIEAHHDDVTANTIEAVLVKLADAISAGRPGARRDTLEIYIKRLQKIEEIVNGYEGIKQSFAVQAGREVRVIVQSEMFDDLASQKLARDIAKKIEDELDYPGQIKVTVVREFRTTEIAK